MQKYLLRRGLFALGTVIGVSLIVFVVLRILPGDPLVALLGVEGHSKMTPADRAIIMKDLGLSDSLPVQYVRWLRDIATGQLGKSFFRGDTVRTASISFWARCFLWRPRYQAPTSMPIRNRCWMSVP